MVTPRRAPGARTPLVGRDTELARLERLVAGSSGRVVTLTGGPGVGKTSLLAELARRLDLDGAAPAWLDVGRAEPGTDLAALAAYALGLVDQPASPADLVADHLAATGRVLLVDDAEAHVAAVAAFVHDLIDRCPGARVVVASRVRLRIEGELVVRVAPLPVPAPPDPADPDLAALGRNPSVALFLERAAAADPEVRLTAANARDVATLCAALDGLPLAIELAAAYAAHLTPAEIVARVQSGDWQQGVSRRSAARDRRTLDAALAASHAQLSAEAQRVFRRAAVFAGGWTLDAAAAVCSLGEPGRDAQQAVIELAEHSLLARSEQASVTTFRFLAPVRAHALARLTESGEAPAAAMAHATFCLAQASARAPGALFAGPADLDRIESLHDDCVRAMTWAEDCGLALPALGLSMALLEHWRVRGRLREGSLHLERLAGMPGLDAAQVAIVQLGRADILRLLGELATAEMIAGAVEAEAERIQAGGLDALLAVMPDRVAAGMAFAGVVLVRRLALGILGDIATARDDLRAARARYDAARVTFDPEREPAAYAVWATNIGRVALLEGRLDEAADHLDAAIDAFGRVGPMWYRGQALSLRASVARRAGDHRRAVALFRDALAWLSDHGARTEAIPAVEELAILCLELEQAERAAMLLGAAAALRRGTGVATMPNPALERVRRGVVRLLGPERADAATIKGGALSLEGIAALADGLIGARVPAVEPRVDEALTPREREVAWLIADGLSNGQIADRLGVSPGTVRTHVERILAKLDLTSRVQVATWIVRAGLAAPEHQTDRLG